MIKHTEGKIFDYYSGAHNPETVGFSLAVERYFNNLMR